MPATGSRRPSPLGSLPATLARAVGGALGVVFATTAGLRRSKALHPVGVVATATLDIEPDGSPSGAPLLDEPGRHECLVRASYAVGTGPELPDIEGFALRLVADGGRPTDLLFASTGDGALGRYVLAVRPPGTHSVQTTLLPVRSGDRPLQLRLRPLDPGTQPWPVRHELAWAHGRGPWRPCGTLTVDWAGPADAPARFDPVQNPLEGTEQYPVVTRLREPAYHLSRLVRPSAGHLPGPGLPT